MKMEDNIVQGEPMCETVVNTVSNSANDKLSSIEDLRKKVHKDFTPEQIKDLIMVGRKLASKAVLSALAVVLTDATSPNYNKSEGDRLAKKINKLMNRDCGFIQLEFDDREISMDVFDGQKFALNCCLALVDKNYKTDVSIPHEDYAKPLYDNYNMLKTTAIAFWRQFMEDNSALYKRICSYRNDVDFSDLHIDENNPTTLYFDENCHKRVGIYCYYVNSEGKPFYKK